MSFFKALGKFITDSGGPYVLTETGALVPGSLLGFLTGKHYNRCKRIHPIFAAALESLHFPEFLSSLNDPLIDIEVNAELTILKENFQCKKIEDIFSLTLVELFQKYELYCKQTINGDHGLTAKFWMTYIELVGV